MKEKISQLMDGELGAQDTEAALRALRGEGEAFDAWRIYHLISDAMRDTPLLSAGFAARLRERLAGEPTVLAPARRLPRPRVVWAAAASLAAVALVGWVAFAPQPEPAAPLAAAPKAAPAAVVAPQRTVPVVAVTSVLPGANDYLLAHQGFSPRVYLQGMAPYLRTVSEPVQEPAK
ncbi:MAG TPA: sigma-E factor negative regulatory protein [Burkholderiales bacterium]